MKLAVLNEQVMRKYLLGGLSEEEREHIEKNMLTDEGFYEDLCSLEDLVEDDLIEQYLDGDLTDGEKKGFEQIFLSTTERREKLELARDLNRRASLSTARSEAFEPARVSTSRWRSLASLLHLENPAVGLSLATALLLMIVSCVWLLFRAQRLETELSEARSQQRNQSPAEQSLKESLDQQRVRNDELAASLSQAQEQRARLEQELNSLKGQNARPQETNVNRPPVQSPAPIFSFVLNPFRGRGPTGEGLTEINIPAKTGRVRLSLALDTINPKDYKSYQATVEKRDGTQIFKTRRLVVTSKDGEDYVGFTLPATLLQDGVYNIELSGVSTDNKTEPLGLYSVRVAAH